MLGTQNGDPECGCVSLEIMGWLCHSLMRDITLHRLKHYFHGIHNIFLLLLAQLPETFKDRNTQNHNLCFRAITLSLNHILNHCFCWVSPLKLKNHQWLPVPSGLNQPRISLESKPFPKLAFCCTLGGTSCTKHGIITLEEFNILVSEARFLYRKYLENIC